MHHTKLSRRSNNGAVLRELTPSVAISHEHRGIRTPRSSSRNYTPAELTTAARMLQQLRRQHDTHILVESIDMQPHDADAVIDIAIDRMLSIL